MSDPRALHRPSRLAVSRRSWRWLAGLICIAACTSAAPGAVVFNLNLDASAADGRLDDGSRWNATSKSFFRGGVSYERSLAGGLRYALEGGSYAAFRDQFTWASTPTTQAFQSAVDDAFDAWTAVDPATGFGTQLSFAYDAATPVDDTIDNWVRLGSEIDLFADNIGSGQRGEARFHSISLSSGLTLTSGTTGYGGYAIAGADITMNSNVTWSSLTDFQIILTHEIGHALGLGDVEDFNNLGFIDNNYDPADPFGTLTDPWAHLVNPLNPADSPALSLYDVPNSSTGIDAPGVDILMESSIPQFFFSQGAAMLKNDDFGGRQFLYPELVPVVTPGDLDGDGDADVDDIDTLMLAVRDGLTAGVYDVNSDLTVDDEDVTHLVGAIIGLLPGDTDGDFDIDNDDIFLILGGAAFDQGDVNAVWSMGDFDNDRDVDNDDIFLILASNQFNQGSYAAMPNPLTPTPEPAVGLLLIVSAAAPLCRRRTPDTSR